MREGRAGVGERERDIDAFIPLFMGFIIKFVDAHTVTHRDTYPEPAPAPEPKLREPLHTQKYILSSYTKHITHCTCICVYVVDVCRHSTS